MKSKPEFGEKGNDGRKRADIIRSLFTFGTTIEAHTSKCFDAGVWTDAENAAAAMAHHRNEVRDALRATIDGVPFAGETGARALDGKPVWRQLSLWDYEDFEYNIGQRVRQSKADIDVINRLIELCLNRFGRAPFEKMQLRDCPDDE